MQAAAAGGASATTSLDAASVPPETPVSAADAVAGVAARRRDGPRAWAVGTWLTGRLGVSRRCHPDLDGGARRGQLGRERRPSQRGRRPLDRQHGAGRRIEHLAPSAVEAADHPQRPVRAGHARRPARAPGRQPSSAAMNAGTAPLPRSAEASPHTTHSARPHTGASAACDVGAGETARRVDAHGAPGAHRERLAEGGLGGGRTDRHDGDAARRRQAERHLQRGAIGRRGGARPLPAHDDHGGRRLTTGGTRRRSHRPDRTT